MATLKEHQAAMVDLLANGSGIPASASRLAHAMHDLLGAVMLQSAARENAADIRALFGMDDATTPGLNDKALGEPQKPLKTDSPSYRPTPAERRITELTNTVAQLRGRVASLKADKCELEDQVEAYRRMAIPEQAGCRKPDTQVCGHDLTLRQHELGDSQEIEVCCLCGKVVSERPV